MKKRSTLAIILVIFIAGLLYTLASDAAPQVRKFCVFDPIGANGPLFNILKADVIPALSWGVKLELHAYTDEKIAAADFKAGQCDQVLLTGARARDFNLFTGTVEAVGAIRSLDEINLLLATLASPKASKFMKQDDIEVVGIMPAGAVRLFVRDKSINSVEKLQGLKFGAMDFDEAAMTMVRKVGASAVPVSITTFAGKFNNGSIDVIYAPVVAYEPLELYKGVGDKGGIFDYPVAHMTFQIIIRADKFPEGYAQSYREHTFTGFPNAVELITEAEKSIPEDKWIVPSPKQVSDYDIMMQESRIDLREAGVYHPKALTLLRKIRCKSSPSNAECATKVE